jgi:hypothetical protein
VTETNLSTDDARSDLRLLGGLLCEPSHIRGKLSAGFLEQIGRTQNEGEVRTIPKLLSAEVSPLKSIKGALSKAIREVSDTIQLRGALDPSKEHRPSPKDEAMSAKKGRPEPP